MHIIGSHVTTIDRHPPVFNASSRSNGTVNASNVTQKPGVKLLNVQPRFRSIVVPTWFVLMRAILGSMEH